MKRTVSQVGKVVKKGEEEEGNLDQIAIKIRELSL